MPADEDDTDLIEIQLFLQAIYAKYGYDLRGYARESMRRRVRAALARSGLPHLGDLQHAILTDASLFARVFDDLIVRVSDMFRDPAFFKAFRAHITPVLRTYARINVWHSGCATGEEVYSIAILLTEEGLYDRSQIYATDVSTRALEQAKEGVYASVSIPAFAHNYQQAGGSLNMSGYYTEAYGRIVFKESVRRNIVFFEHDLVGDHVFAEMQVILCRNVLIYFGPELRQRVLAKFVDSLCPGGFLCLGASERISSAVGGAFDEVTPAERIYRRTRPA